MRRAIQGGIDAEAKGQEEVNEEVEEIDPQNLEVELPHPPNEYRLVNTSHEELQGVQVTKEDWNSYSFIVVLKCNCDTVIHLYCEWFMILKLVLVLIHCREAVPIYSELYRQVDKPKVYFTKMCSSKTLIQIMLLEFFKWDYTCIVYTLLTSGYIKAEERWIST